MSKTSDDFLLKYSESAKIAMQKTGVPASVTLAQAILETGWGTHAPANNFFGIKGTGPAGSVSLRTREVINNHSVYVMANFRAYHNAEESFEDHGNFLKNNPRYSAAFSYKNDALNFIRAIALAGYATDPNYANGVISIINNHNLLEFDK